MDLDDEPHAPPEPIEQPALQMVQENQDDQEGTAEPSQPKKQRLDSGNCILLRLTAHASGFNIPILYLYNCILLLPTK